MIHIWYYVYLDVENAPMPQPAKSVQNVVEKESWIYWEKFTLLYFWSPILSDKNEIFLVVQ